MHIVGVDGDCGEQKCVWIRRDDVNVNECERTGVFSCVFCSDSNSPIHLAADQGHSSTLDLLLAKNADVNARDE